MQWLWEQRSFQTNDLLILVSFFLRRSHKQIGKNFKFGNLRISVFKMSHYSKQCDVLNIVFVSFSMTFSHKYGKRYLKKINGSIKCPEWSWEKETKSEALYCPTSNCITMLQLSKQHGMKNETNTQTNKAHYTDYSHILLQVLSLFLIRMRRKY